MKKIILIILLLLSFNTAKALENTGSITLNFYDDITKSKVNSGLLSFKGTKIQIQRDDEVLGLGTVKGNILVFSDLEKGTYTLSHNLMSEGYQKKDDIYTFIIDGNNVTKDIYLKPEETLLNIKKYYGNSKLGTKYPMNKSTFSIYDENNKLVKQVETNEKGIIETNLVYGQYKIIDDNTNESFSIYKNMFANIINKKTFFEEKYEAKLKIKLLEYNTLIPLKNVKFVINNKEYTTNSNGIIITEVLPNGLYKLECEFIKDYYKTDDVSISINEDSNYYVENDEVFIDVNIYKEKLIEETSNTNENKDSTNEKEDNTNEKEDNNVEKEDNTDKNEDNTNENQCDNDQFDCYVEEDEPELEKLPYLHTTNYLIYFNYLLLIVTAIYAKKVFNN